MGDATTIDEVVERIEAIISTSKARASRLGYFAALYREVTLEVKDRIASDFFDDGERMAHLDVVFANRDLRALDQYEKTKDRPRFGSSPSTSPNTGGLLSCSTCCSA